MVCSNMQLNLFSVECKGVDKPHRTRQDSFNLINLNPGNRFQWRLPDCLSRCQTKHTNIK